MPGSDNEAFMITYYPKSDDYEVKVVKAVNDEVADLNNLSCTDWQVAAASMIVTLDGRVLKNRYGYRRSPNLTP